MQYLHETRTKILANLLRRAAVSPALKGEVLPTVSLDKKVAGTRRLQHQATLVLR